MKTALRHANKKLFPDTLDELKEILQGFPTNGHEPVQFGFTGNIDGDGLDNASGYDAILTVHIDKGDGKLTDVKIHVSTLLAYALYGKDVDEYNQETLVKRRKAAKRNIKK